MIEPKRAPETVLANQELQVERKHFSISLRENERGRFLRVVEEAQGRRNTVIVPSTGLADFATALATVIESATKKPAA